MEDEAMTMSAHEWCLLTYRACQLGDPDARLEFARLYRESVDVENNVRYALFWYVMAFEAYLKKGREDFIAMRKIDEEIRAVAGELSDDEARYVKDAAKYVSKFSVGVAGPNAPSDQEVVEFWEEHRQRL